ncbi:MAG: DUF2293 domain-containing protein [Lentisphaeria bacterium]|nr:DUF2293 domain-containing protein [Lentisphaeria bacterium]
MKKNPPPEKEEFHVWETMRKREFKHGDQYVTVPENWAFVPSGDPGLTRRLKASGECWIVVYRRKNRIESKGLWTDSSRIEAVKAALEEERSSPEYLKKLEAARRARIAKQDAYVVEFRQAVVDFLNFAPCYEEMAWDIADAVTDTAVPVGSGTVARTERIPVAARAEAAVIAWMRHQTTAYDHMHIARIKGERRQVRRELASGSRKLLEKYRNGEQVDPESCPLAQALR